MVQVGQS